MQSVPARLRRVDGRRKLRPPLPARGEGIEGWGWREAINLSPNPSPLAERGNAVSF
jgi:hypothetical protein